MAATHAAATELFALGADVGERRHQQRFMRRALASQAGWRVQEHEETLRLPGWCHPPRGIDVDARDPAGARWIGELKLRETDQILWDLLKVADALRLDGISGGFLQVGTSGSDSSRSDMCAELLRGGVAEHDTLSLFRSNRGAWSNLLHGGTARPLKLPRVIKTEVLADPPIRLGQGAARLALVAVEPEWSGATSMDPAWWCGDWPPGVEPHESYINWRRRHCGFLRALAITGPLHHDQAQKLSKQHGLNLERDTALTHACEPLVTKRPIRAVTDHGHAFLQVWETRLLTNQ